MFKVGAKPLFFTQKQNKKNKIEYTCSRFDRYMSQYPSLKSKPHFSFPFLSKIPVPYLSRPVKIKSGLVPKMRRGRNRG